MPLLLRRIVIVEGLVKGIIDVNNSADLLKGIEVVALDEALLYNIF